MTYTDVTHIDDGVTAVFAAFPGDSWRQAALRDVVTSVLTTLPGYTQHIQAHALNDAADDWKQRQQKGEGNVVVRWLRSRADALAAPCISCDRTDGKHNSHCSRAVPAPPVEQTPTQEKR